MKSRVCVFVVSFLYFQVLLCWAQPVSAAEDSAVERQIRTQDRLIFLELVKLAQFNVRFQQTANHYARWRNIAYPLGQEAGYACFLGYTLTDLNQRSQGWNNPGLISPRVTKSALSSATVGSLLGSSSSLIELAANGVETVRTSRRGFSVRKSVSFVQSTLKQIDQGIARRHALMEQSELTGSSRELSELKEELLKYERDRLVYEFKQWSAHSRGYAWYRNAFYVINAAVNMGRFSAIQLGFKSFSQPKCGGATGPILIASSALAALGPIASSTIGNIVSRRQMHLLSKSLPVSPFLSDEEAKHRFERLAQLLTDANGQNGTIAADLIRMREEKLGLDKLILHQEKTIERLHRVAGQQAITAPTISTLGVASGILSTVGYHGYRQQPIVKNRISVAGDVAVLPAEAVALIATPAAAIASYRYERNLKRKGEHPDQLLSTRLKDLQALERIVTDAWQ